VSPKLQKKPYVCSPLSVVTNADGKLRLVLNLRYLNQFLHVEKFKYEDFHVALLMVDKDDFLFKLKSGYHHLDIFEPHQKILGFAWKMEGTLCYFVYTVLPFGLSPACFVFTKLLCPLVKFRRGSGLKVILYLDDGLVAVPGKERANHETIRVQSDLQKARLITNESKSQWTPTKKLDWLCFELDLQSGRLTVPEGKLCCLLEEMTRARDGHQLTVTALTSVVGKIVSMSLALGPVTI